MISIIGATHPGQREHNEDCFIADSSLGLGLVADGMGGYACGEVASQLVQHTVHEAVTRNEGLQEAIARAHAVVKETAAADEAKRGMGSTAIALKIQGLDYEIAWVGDSRAYLWSQSDAELRQITRDHSYVETLLSSGAITQQEAINHPNRNLITQAVGVAGDDGLAIEVIHGRLASGQQLILCSDGLVDEVVDQDIAGLLAAAVNPAHALDSLVEAAVTAGGRDNITVVIATVDGDTESDTVREPEVIRSTRVDSAVDSSTRGASTQAASEINRATIVSAEGDTTGTPSYGRDFVELVRHNAVVIAVGIVITLVVGLGLFYLS